MRCSARVFGAERGSLDLQPDRARLDAWRRQTSAFRGGRRTDNTAGVPKHTRHVRTSSPVPAGLPRQEFTGIVLFTASPTPEGDMGRATPSRPLHGSGGRRQNPAKISPTATAELPAAACLSWRSCWRVRWHGAPEGHGNATRGHMLQAQATQGLGARAELARGQCSLGWEQKCSRRETLSDHVLVAERLRIYGNRYSPSS